MRCWARTLLVLCVCGSLGLKANASGFSAPSSGAADEVHFSPDQIAAFAKKVERTIAATGARVAIVSRVGVPLDQVPEGFHYSHVGFAAYSQITTADGRVVPGYAMYNLYQEDAHPDVSDLVQDYPAPMPLCMSPIPFTLGRQNCTDFVLDVIMSAIYETDDIVRIKAAERAYFGAQPVTVNPVKLLAGSLFIPAVSTSDQPAEPVTATFERISDFVRNYDAGSRSFTVLAE